MLFIRMNHIRIRLGDGEEKTKRVIIVELRGETIPHASADWWGLLASCFFQIHYGILEAV